MDKKTYYGFLISFIITLAIHYFLFSRIVMHPTLHVTIGIVLFFAIFGFILLLMKKRK